MFMRFPSVVDTPLTIICKVDGSIPMQWYFLYHFDFEYDYNSLARAFFSHDLFDTSMLNQLTRIKILFKGGIHFAILATL